MPGYPLVKQRKAKLSGVHGLHHKLISSGATYFQIESVQQQKGVHRSEPCPLLAVEESGIVEERPEQRRGFFVTSVVVTRLRAKDGGFERAMIAQAVDASIFLDLVMMDGDDFSHRQVDALGQQIMISMGRLDFARCNFSLADHPRRKLTRPGSCSCKEAVQH
jgi:hypothetical protein